MVALLMAAFQIAITPFLTAVGGGLGNHVAEWVWSTVSNAGHPDIAQKMKTGNSAPEEQKTAQRAVAAAIAEPAKAQEFHQIAAVNPVVQPIAQHYSALLSVKPEVWTDFASGSSTLRELAETQARWYSWSQEHLSYEITRHCPIGGEQLSLFGVTFIDITGKNLQSAWQPRPTWLVVCPDGQFRQYAITAHCENGHQWQVYAP